MSAFGLPEIHNHITYVEVAFLNITAASFKQSLVLTKQQKIKNIFLLRKIVNTI